MTQQALASIRKFCYNCAADDHFGDDCKERQAGNGYGYRMAVSAFNLYSLPEVPKGNTTSRNAKNRDDREFSNGYDNYDTKKDGKRKRSASGGDKYYDRDAAEPDNRRKSTGGGGGGGWNSKSSSQQQYNQPASGAYDDRRKSTGSNYHNQGNNHSQYDVADRWDGGRNNGNRRDSSVGPNRNNKTADRWDGGRGAGRPNYPPIDKNANRGKR
ncbi:hypothetical protein HDU79_001639 [Rhizoclosmatium sp. JEL0117]|nr:hypothetical protein HDU79_001639 [Rhizoclosmatium sp. JEL0117]